MEIFFSIRELKSLIEEGRRGLYKAAKLLKDLDPNDVQNSIQETLEVLYKLFDAGEDQLNEITIDNTLKLIVKLPDESVKEIVTELIKSPFLSAKELAGLIILRYPDKIDVDIAIEVSKSLLEIEELKYMSIAILKEIKKAISSDTVLEFLEAIIKRDPVDLDLFFSTLRFLADKIPVRDLYHYIEHLYNRLSDENKELFIQYFNEIKNILPKKVRNIFSEKSD